MKRVMQTVQVKLLKEGALSILLQLEQLEVIEIDDSPSDTIQEDPFDARSLLGSISEETGEAVLAHIEKSRAEWESRI